MKKKKLLSIGFAAMGLCGAAVLLRRLWLEIILRFNGVTVNPGQSATIGIIGGADGPTAIFVTGPDRTAYILPAVLTVLGVAGFLLLRNTGKK